MSRWGLRALWRSDGGDTRTEYAASGGLLALSGIAGTVLISATTGQAIEPNGTSDGESVVEQATYNGPRQHGDCDAGDADQAGGYENGRIPTDALCELHQAEMFLRSDAAVTFLHMNEAYTEEFGSPMHLNAAYRTYARQVELHAEMGYPAAAVPGTSNHGKAVAVDIEVGSFRSETYLWLNANAGNYDWGQPEQMKEGGSNEEAWHWEYTPGVAA